MAVAPGVHRVTRARPREMFTDRGRVALGGDAVLCLAEQRSSVRRVRFSTGAGTRDYALSAPRTVAVVKFWRQQYAGLYMYACPAGYTGPQTTLQHLLLPNIFSSGRVCMGDEDRVVQAAGCCADYEAKGEAVLSDFWTTPFNEHLIGRFNAEGVLAHPALVSVAAWAQSTRQNPNFVLRVNWPVAGTIRQLIDASTFN